MENIRKMFGRKAKDSMKAANKKTKHDSEMSCMLSCLPILHYAYGGEKQYG